MKNLDWFVLVIFFIVGFLFSAAIIGGPLQVKLEETQTKLNEAWDTIHDLQQNPNYITAPQDRRPKYRYSPHSDKFVRDDVWGE